MPVAFKDIGKSCSDLLTKDYKVGKNTVELKSKTPNGITFTPSSTKSDKGLDGSLAAKYSIAKGMDTELTLNTAGVFKCTFEAAKVIAGMNVKVEGETAAPGKPGMLSSGMTEVDYTTGPLKCKASYDFYKGDVIASASGTFTGITVGAECGYSTTKSALSKYAAACQYVQPDFTVSAKLSEVLAKSGSQTFSGAYYHKVSGDMQVGAELSKVASKSDVDLAFGCLYKLDKTTTVKGKVDSDGKLLASFKQQLSPLTLITLAAEIDTVNLNEGKHKFGMVMNLTP
jgi:voltage-dependent anion channel protein 2